MVRPKKLMAPGRGTDEDSSADGSLMVQSRGRRTIKPNPKYNSQEIVPLKRIDGLDDDDEEEDEADEAEQSREDDEDFRDDGIRDSDPEDSPPVRRRPGRPPASSQAPRSEPQPQRRLQQIRQGFRETARSTSKIMLQATIGAGGLLEKKRKLDYEEDEGESDEPSSKRKPNAVSTPVATRTTATRVVANSTPSSGKENATSVLKKPATQPTIPNEVKLVNVATILNKKLVPPAKVTAVSTITTRRTQGPPAAKPATTPPTSVVRTAASTVNSSTSAVTTTPRRVVSVAQATPTRIVPTKPALTPGAAAPVVTPKVSAIEKQVLLNRSPAPTPKPATPNAISSVPARPIVIPNKPKITPSPMPARPIISKGPGSVTPSTPGAQKAYLVPADAKLEKLEGNKTRVTTFEKRFVVRVPPAPEPSQGDWEYMGRPVTLVKLRNEIKLLKMPSALWSYQMKLHSKRGAPDAAVDVPDKPGYMVHSVVLNRTISQSSPTKDAREFDRTVEVLRNKYNVTMNGRPVLLVDAPATIRTRADLETLMDIVDDLTLDSPVVKVIEPKPV